MVIKFQNPNFVIFLDGLECIRDRSSEIIINWKILFVKNILIRFLVVLGLINCYGTLF